MSICPTVFDSDLRVECDGQTLNMHSQKKLYLLVCAVIDEVDKSESVKTNVKKTPIRKASLAKIKWTTAATTKAKRKNLNINGVARRTDMENELKLLLSMAISNHGSSLNHYLQEWPETTTPG